MANITASSVTSTFRTRVRDFANTSIIWGTNNKPANSLASWFGGTTAGNPYSPADSSVGASGVTLTPGNLHTWLQAYTDSYANIRKAKITIYRTRSGYSNNASTLIYDETKVCYLSTAYRAYVSNASVHYVERGYTASKYYVDQYIERLRSNYSVARNSVQNLSNSVCHDSCHSDCHDSRNRR